MSMVAAGAGLGAERWSPVAPVPHPDLAKLDPAVAQQLRTARADFESSVDRNDVASTALATSYGILGQHYQAYEILDAAEACYQNAVALAPGEFAWRYSLAVVV